MIDALKFLLGVFCLTEYLQPQDNFSPRKWGGVPENSAPESPQTGKSKKRQLAKISFDAVSAGNVRLQR